MHLKLCGHAPSEDQLPKLGPADAGRTYWVGWVWFIWTGDRWQAAVATTTTGPKDVA